MKFDVPTDGGTRAGLLLAHHALAVWRRNPALRPGPVTTIAMGGIVAKVTHILDDTHDLLVANGLPGNTKLITQNLRKPNARWTPWILEDPENRDLSWWMPQTRRQFFIGECRSYVELEDPDRLGELISKVTIFPQAKD